MLRTDLRSRPSSAATTCALQVVGVDEPTRTRAAPAAAWSLVGVVMLALGDLRRR
jgi:hypothetical protein